MGCRTRSLHRARSRTKYRKLLSKDWCHWRWPSRSCRHGSCRYGLPNRTAITLSESSVYRILKRRDLMTAPAFIVMQAADKFNNPTTAVNQLWQTDFTYLKIIGWGWFYLSTVMDDFSRYIVAWRLCKTMSAADVAATLRDALQRRCRSGPSTSRLSLFPVLFRTLLLPLKNGGPSVRSIRGLFQQEQLSTYPAPGTAFEGRTHRIVTYIAAKR